MQPARFDSLQAGRALAALGVAAYHARTGVAAFIGPLPGWADAVLEHGQLGVDFFFVLSGFIILHVHRGDPQTPTAARAFAAKRLLRIFPSYWPVSLALLAVYALLPGLSAAPREGVSLLTSLLLLPDSAPPALVVAWTLEHELLFYAVFMLRYWSAVGFLAAMAAWMAAIAAVQAGLLPMPSHPALLLVCNPINAEFLLGLGVAWLLRRTGGALIGTRSGGAKSRGAWLAQGRLAGAVPIVGGVAVLALLAARGAGIDGRLGYAAGFSAMLFGALLLEVRRVNLHARWLAWFGDASYALYLVHLPVQSVVSRVLVRVGMAGHPWLGLLCLLLASIAGGVLYFRLVERPLLRLCRRAVPALR